MIPAAQERLDGWKSIANYLKRTTRTVQRWEKLEGLPVHRIGHTSSASVFAYSGEIDAWWDSRKAGLEPQLSQPADSGTVEPRKILNHKTALRIGVLALAGFLAIGAGSYYLYSHPRPRFSSVEVLTPVKRGNVEMAAISPDGQTLVYAWDLDNQHTLTVRDLASGAERTLVQGVYSRYYGLTFSRDGRSLYFAGQQAGQISSLYRSSLLGGNAVRILEGIDSPVSFSPGEKKIAFVREAAESQLLVANADGTGQKNLLSRKLPEYLDYPAWSPDGKVIVASSVSRDGARLVRVDPDSGAESPVGNQMWSFLRFPVWLDHNHLAVSLRVSRASERLFVISYPDAKAEAINLPPDRFFTLSASMDGRSLAGVVVGGTSSIWTGDGSGEPREIISAVAGTRGIGWNGNGRLLIGTEGISAVKPDGTDLTAVLKDLPYSHFAVCGTNRLAYTRYDAPNAGLWQVVLPDGVSSGGVSKLLAAYSNPGKPHCSPDGAWVVYSGRWTPAYQISSNGGAEQTLIQDSVWSPAVSRDNRWIAAYRSRGESTAQAPQEIAIYPRSGGAAVKTLPLRPGGFDWTVLRWSPDNQALGYIEKRGGVANLWLQPVDGGPPRQLTQFRGGRVIDFDWAPDGQLAVEFGTVVRDVFLIRDKGN